MFIRRTKTRTTDQGESYYSYRLVDTARVGDRVHQRTLLNLGSGFSIAPEHWKALTQRIEHILLGQHDLLPMSITSEVEREAQQIAASLLSKYNNAVLTLSPQKTTAQTPVKPATASTDPSAADDRDMRRVDLDSLVMMDSRCVGAEAVALAALRQSRLDEKLQALGFNPKQLHAAIGNIIGRMIRPGSELSTHRWLQEQSALGELLGGELAPSLTALYRASDLLWKHHEAIETFLYQQHCALFDVAETITLFDLTNTFFEGTGQYNDHAAYGHSKEKRSDCPLVTLALVLDGSGFSRRSRIFPGNVSEPGTLQQMIDTLRTPQDAQPTSAVDANASSAEHTDTRQQALDFGSLPTIIMDAGIATEENVTWLQQQGYPYLVVSRKRHLAFDENQAVTVKTGADDAVRAVRVEREDGEIELYCHSQGREAKERAIGQCFSTRFEHELQHLAEGLDKPRRLKSAHKVCEKIGRLRQKYARAAKHYEIKTELDASGKKVVALHYQRVAAPSDTQGHLGVYCLRSNRRDWDERQLWRTYTLLTDLEAVFRSLKSELGLRPVYHQKTHRVEGHLFITVLAYNLVHQIRLRLKAEGINESWETIRTALSTQMRTTVTLRGDDGEQIHIRKSSYPNAEQQVLLRALDLPWNPGGTQKTIVSP